MHSKEEKSACQARWYQENRIRLLEKAKSYYRTHREKIMSYQRKYVERFPDRVSNWKRESYLRNIVEHKRRAKLYALENAEHLKQKKHEYTLKNIIHIKQVHRNWKQANRDRVRHTNRMREIRELNAVGSHTLEQWRALLELYGFKCLRCKRGVEEVRLYRDHVVPLCKGGSNFIDNIQPLCMSCNCIKARKTIDYRNAQTIS